MLDLSLFGEIGRDRSTEEEMLRKGRRKSMKNPDIDGFDCNSFHFRAYFPWRK